MKNGAGAFAWYSGSSNSCGEKVCVEKKKGSSLGCPVPLPGVCPRSELIIGRWGTGFGCTNYEGEKYRSENECEFTNASGKHCMYGARRPSN